ncbi:MAG TPA: alpha/beta hydrolase [Candidatus Dormibacteraeota bacterium]|nr:alpha/beta hydrolase [Candidatus Dormibacteraeota bacterium]
MQIDQTELTFADVGGGRPFLLLHGGGGPLTVSPFAELLASTHPARVITPTHPGFAGTPRPENLRTVRDLAGLYVDLVAHLDLRDVTVVGNSIGGWIAAEMSLLDTSRVGRFVLVDAVGIQVEGHPIIDFFSLTPRQIAEASYHDPDRFGIDPTKLPLEAQKAMAANRAALTSYSGPAMSDPTLVERLAAVTRPVLVVWGDADRIVDVEYGRAWATAIPGAKFDLLTETGHLPQIETPQRLMSAIWAFASGAA